MNLNQFQYLLAIHKCGSITKAAQELFVSVPSISSAIKNLEDELGCTLLLRHRHGVTFTEQGEEAVRLLAEVEERLEALGKLAYYQDTNLTGQIKLGGTPHLNHSLVLPMLVRIRDSYPELKITPVDGDSPSILRMVAQGSLDLAILTKGLSYARFAATICNLKSCCSTRCALWCARNTLLRTKTVSA